MSTLPRLFVASLLLACTPSSTSHPSSPPSPSGPALEFTQTDATFLLFRAEARFGEERVRVHPGATPELRSNFVYSDRGNRVPLASALTLGADGLPRRFALWGSTSPMTEIDLDVIVEADAANIRDDHGTHSIPLPPLYFTTATHAPLGVTEALIAAWHGHGRPATIPLLPEGTVDIRKRGSDSFELGGQTITLERLDLAGLGWGHEVLWIDDHRQLIAAVGGSFVGVRQGFEPLLEQFYQRAAADGVARQAEQGPAPIHDGRYAIVHARLFDGTGAAPIDDATIVIDGGTITAAGRGPVPDGVAILDAHGQTVLPGLWDMHAHVEQVEWGPVYLAAGVTTVRDMGNSLAFLAGMQGAKLGPRILCAGLIDGVDGDAIGKLRVRTVADVEPALDAVEAAGCKQIKIYMSVDPALVEPLAEGAHRRGLDVAGHVPRGMTLDEVVDAGMDVVSHLDGLSMAVLPAGTPAAQMLPATLALDPDSPHARSVYANLVERDVATDPTLALAELLLLGAAAEPGASKLPSVFEPMLARLGPPPGSPPEIVAAHGQVFGKFVATVGALHRAGGTIVAGSDASVPGHSLHREIELYVAAGMSPVEAIGSATTVPARVMGLAHEVGTITPGKRADLIVVDGDPLTNISDLRNISVVVTAGRAYEPDPLWRLVDFEP